MPEETKRKREKTETEQLIRDCRRKTVPVSVEYICVCEQHRLYRECQSPELRSFKPERERPDLAHQQIETLQCGTF